jgi:hypothetical protein
VNALCQAANGCMLGATGVVSIPKPALAKAFKLRRAKTRAVGTGQAVKLTLKLSRKTQKAVKRALSKKRYRRKVKATVRITDSAPAAPLSVKKTVRFGRR